MRRAVLVDTSALLALTVRSDPHHKKAVSTLAGLKSEKRPLVATTDVFDETVTLVRRWEGYADAVRTGRSLRESRILELVAVNDLDRDTAWDLFEEYKDPKLSYTDCTSAAVMRRLELEEVFTFDADFRAFGFRPIPDER
ncbi:MAG TPA: PIN domain-containing protein [Planctomycetota bacterium]|jgi:hypothetical protein|nr:PIN domain-containing protein [Planctomycetota bacterium]